jgi:hypothetical protein
MDLEKRLNPDDGNHNGHEWGSLSQARFSSMLSALCHWSFTG